MFGGMDADESSTPDEVESQSAQEFQDASGRKTFRKSTIKKEATIIAFGACSIFDLSVTQLNPLPFAVPIATYIEEILIGLQCAPDATLSPSSHAGGNARAQYNRLCRVVKAGCMCDVCETLFWILLGVIADRVAFPVVIGLKNKLAQSWCNLVLEVRQLVRSDMVAQDWLLAAVPVIIVQTTYRLFVDCFPPERQQMIMHADPLLEKMSHVVTFEVCGFHRNVETCMNERRLLFKQAVLELPYVNLRESVKNQKRKEFLEEKGKGAGPLAFGRPIQDGGEPLEQTQLEHIMEGREQDREQAELLKFQSQPKPVPKELDVARYDSFSHKGSVILERQLEELLPVDVWSDEEHAEESIGNRDSLVSHGEPRDRVEVNVPGPSRGRPSLEQPELSQGRQRSSSSLRGAARASQFAHRVSKAAHQKEAAAADKKKRDESLRKKIVDDPLPSELCVCSLDTTWVSPMTNRLARPEQDRRALRKPLAEAHQLKMAQFASSSLPNLLQSESADSGKEGRIRTSLRNLPAISRPSTSSAPGRDWEVVSEAASEAASERKRDAARDGHGHSGRTRSATGGIRHPTNKVLRSVCQSEKMVLEPPPNLNNDIVMHRLHSQLSTLKANSFAVYSRTYDIVSGVKKNRMDPEVISDAETAYVSSMQSLVGSSDEPGLKMFDSPVQKYHRKLKKKEMQKKCAQGNAKDSDIASLIRQGSADNSR